MRGWVIGVVIGLAALGSLAASAGGGPEVRQLRAEVIALRADLVQRDRQVAQLAAAAADCRGALVDAERRAFEIEAVADAPDGSRWDWSTRSVVPPEAAASPADAPPGG